MASINCPITSGTLWMRLISSCARTNSLFKLLWYVSLQNRDACLLMLTFAHPWCTLLAAECTWFLLAIIPQFYPHHSSYSRCRWSFFSVEYSSLPSVPKPSKLSMFGIDEGICFRWGNTWFAGFSNSTSPILNELRRLVLLDYLLRREVRWLWWWRRSWWFWVVARQAQGTRSVQQTSWKLG